jgi:hypothetical protein
MKPFGAKPVLKGTVLLMLTLGFMQIFACSQGWQIETLDAAGDVDAWVDMTLDAAGYPHICCQNRFYGNLNYHWKNAFGWHFDVVEHNDAPFGGRIALDNQARPYVLYSDLNTWQLTLAHLTAYGWQISHPIDWIWQADPTGIEMTGWDVVVDPGTNIPVSHYTWRQTHEPFEYQIAWAPNVEDASLHPWTVHVIADSLADQIEGVNGSMALGADGMLRGVFFDEGAQDLLYWATDQPGAPVPLVTAGAVGRYNAIALDGNSQPHIVYTDETQETVNYLTAQAAEVISPVGAYTLPRFTSIALDVLGHPHVTFTDERTQDLMYAFRDGAGRWRLSKVDHVGPYPSYEAVAVGALNVPRVAYLAFGNLKFATGVPFLDGDLDGDGAATTRDLLLVLSAAEGRFTPGVPPCAYPLAGDFDGSGGPSATDRLGMMALLAEND